MARGKARGMARGLTRNRPQPDLDERLRQSRLKSYLLADETPILAQHQHWAALWKVIALGIAGPFVLAVLAVVLPPGLDEVNPFLLLAWVVGFSVWATWKWYLWQRKWLVATNKRLLVNYGLIRQGVSMISLARVVDLTYTRTTFGQVLGYGTLERESQKHPHSLHEVRWVKNPDRTYLTICAAIFDLQDRMFGMDEVEHEHRFENVPPPHAPGLYAGDASPSGRPATGDLSNDEIDSAGIQIHYGVSRHYDRDPWHLSADLRDSSLREADTGPIPYRASATDEGAWQPTTNDRDRDGAKKADRHSDRKADRHGDKEADRHQDGDRDRDRDGEDDHHR